MKITFLGHACLSIETNGTHLLIDPFISGNPKASKIDIDQVKADYILLTHAHQDHVLDVETICRRTKAKIISNYEIVTHYQSLGFEGHPMNHGGSWEFDFGKVKYTQAVHTSSFADGKYGGQPGGFVIQTVGETLYIAGDTALTYDMQLIPRQFRLDLVVLPIGDNFTMGVDEAVTASDFVNCNRILGYHYDTFGYIEIDKEAAIDTFKKAEKELILLDVGDSLTVWMRTVVLWILKWDRVLLIPNEDVK